MVVAVVGMVVVVNLMLVLPVIVMVAWVTMVVEQITCRMMLVVIVVLHVSALYIST